DYHVRGELPGTGARGASRSSTADLTFRPSRAANARVADGSTASVAMHGDSISYNVDATVSEIDLEAIGQQFGVSALSDDRYRSVINGHIAANGRGPTASDMNRTASGTLNDSSIMGGRVTQLAFDATFASDAAHVKAM